MLDGHWHFQCSECGMGDFEPGHLAADQELFCEVCLEEEGRLIRLQRGVLRVHAGEQADSTRHSALRAHGLQSCWLLAHARRAKQAQSPRVLLSKSRNS